MNNFAAISTYTKVGLESGVTAADPHRLILMLFEGALKAIGNAKSEMQHKEIAAKGKSISHAIRIIGEGLDASLNKTAGGALAQDLSALYAYMISRLFDANLKNDTVTLDEVTRMLSELKEAWSDIRPNKPFSVTPSKTARNEQLIYARG